MSERTSTRIQLSGPNGQRAARTVYFVTFPTRWGLPQTEEELGQVIPVANTEAWEARDMQGKSHGDQWLTDWYAAEALARGLGKKI